MFRKSNYLTLVCGLVFLMAGSSAFADDYFVYSTFNPAEAVILDSAGSYVENYGVPGTWGDELQYIYVTSGSWGYKYRAWVENEGSPADPTPFIDIKQHPDHYDPIHVGPIEPRFFEFVSSASLYNGGHTDEFHIDSTGVYLGAYPSGINKWDHDWNFVEKIANIPPERTESLAYNPGENIWYAGGRYRTIYQISDTDNDGSFMDESWQAIFSHPNYGGSHHDGMEYIGGFLWISDMTSDVIGKWEYDSITDTWSEVGRYYYSEPAYVEGMGFGANDHFWLTGSGYYFYELGNKITMYYPIADAGEDVESYPPTIPLEFDASGSHQTDPDRSIALYEWDFDGDGIYDASSIDPIFEHTYPACYLSDGSIDWACTLALAPGGDGCYTAMLRVTDDDPVSPKTAMDIRVVCITEPPWEPIADPDGPYNPRVNQEVCLDGSGSFHPAAEMYEPEHPWYDEIVSWEWDLDNDGQFDDATGEAVCVQWSIEGTYFICLRVTDGEGQSDEKCTTVLVAPGIHDVAVESIIPSQSTLFIGEEATIDVTVSNLGDFTESFDVTLWYDSVEIGVGNVTDLTLGDTAALTFSWDTTGVPDGTYTIKACAEVVPGEINIGDNCLETTVELISNRPPVAVCQGAVVAIGEVPNIDGGSYDPDEGDTITLSQSPSGAFAEAGIYEVTLTVTDSYGATDSCTAMVVVYDPTGGFVTGGGWINSPEGAYMPDPSLTGKANFGFISKYKKGASIPTGQTEFQFHVADLNFHSSSYDWLVVTGSNYAMFKGIGTINGSGSYRFMLWAGDGEPDTFRIKIWTEDNLGNETIVYDNGSDQPIDGGSIVVHTKK